MEQRLPGKVTDIVVLITVVAFVLAAGAAMWLSMSTIGGR
ncbi:hypothetical protein A8924_0233 [Saccharopolyspora erythraea NRRL 2338]|uniref:Uncharacterized protein n=2 Tax=Saccharopolyspora erythraea TaxID=1836 RepID=A4FQT1_SACEN|nr:hypothetical protein N599_02795 [Saccharopolyspora erythraea D]PFG93008.1 hypothetical protein A8924_0233 [Saccharopolyspora erythraea NRRL 2338]CAM06406.1 hypothetical protein SACE_7248 [Saccharopolyspora erythraea NRRL 2338]